MLLGGLAAAMLATWFRLRFCSLHVSPLGDWAAVSDLGDPQESGVADVRDLHWRENVGFDGEKRDQLRSAAPPPYVAKPAMSIFFEIALRVFSDTASSRAG
jgi:hypothetical protein